MCGYTNILNELLEGEEVFAVDLINFNGNILTSAVVIIHDRKCSKGYITLIWLLFNIAVLKAV